MVCIESKYWCGVPTKSIVNGITMEQQLWNSFWSLRKNDIWDLVRDISFNICLETVCVLCMTSFWWMTTPSRYINDSSNLQRMNAVDYVHHHNSNLAGSEYVEMLAAKQILFRNKLNICYLLEFICKTPAFGFIQNIPMWPWWVIFFYLEYITEADIKVMWLSCFRSLKIQRNSCSP